MTCRGCFRAFSLFLWLELIGFDNTLPDFGVDRYLSRMERKPDADRSANNGIIVTPWN